MALGILTHKSSLGALGVVTQVPGECWEQAGFKDCYGLMWKTAQLECQNQGKNTDECIVPRTDQLVEKGCKCVKKPKTSVTSSSFSSKTIEPLEPSGPTLMGFDLKTIIIAGVVGYGIYTLTTDDKKKGKG